MSQITRYDIIKDVVEAVHRIAQLPPVEEHDDDLPDEYYQPSYDDVDDIELTYPTAKITISIEEDSYMEDGCKIIINMRNTTNDYAELSTCVSNNAKEVAFETEYLIEHTGIFDTIDEDINHVKRVQHHYNDPKQIQSKPITQTTTKTQSTPLTKNKTTSHYRLMPENLFNDWDSSDDHRDTDKTIIEILKETDFDFLLDEPNITEDESSYEDQEDYYYDAFNDDEEDDAEYPDGKYAILKERFLCPELTDSEFLYETPWHLLHISKAQFDLIDPADFSYKNFPIFCSLMSNPAITSVISDVEDRIKYCTLIANLPDAAIYNLFNKDEIIYVLKLAKLKALNDAIEAMQLYQDYLSSRAFAIAYNDQFIRDNPDPPHPYYNYVKCPKPSKLKDLHDKAVRDAVLYEETTNHDNIVELDKMIAEINKSVEYKQFLYTGKDYSVIAVTSVADLKLEGKVLQHCIGTYGNKFASGMSMLYFVRRNQCLDTPFYSAEIIQHPGYCELSQLYTFRDSIDKTEDFKLFIYQWCKDKKISIHCPI